MPDISDFIGNYASEDDMNYAIHIATTHKVILFSNPKAGSTTVKGSFNLSLAAATGVPLQYTYLGGPHVRDQNLMQTPAQIGYARFLDLVSDPEVLKFSIIRDPVSRFCSAYASKIARNTPIYRKFVLALPASYGISLGMDISVKQFAHMIAHDDGLRDVDEHWRLQKLQICYDLVPDMCFGRQESLEVDVRRILGRIFGEGYVFFDAPRFNARNASRSAEIRGMLDDEDLANIRIAYAEDYACLPFDGNHKD
jgi:hypothetical protein